uniref:Mortality factor 4-like protein 1 n=1 Tax=Vombatus ursinus TaxID=29139 RepID=A0A4X2KAD5_VOMUR
MAPKQAPKPEFQEGERVLCFHGPLLYEAKCLKVAREDKQVRYLIHYSGWNKNWDEWVPESRVLKYSEANLQKQCELQRANQDKQKMGGGDGGGAGPSTSAARGSPQPPQRRRTRGDQASKSQAPAPARAEPQVQIPAELKPLLVRDWELVSKEGRLFALPAARNVDAILADYVAYKKAQGRRDSLEYAADELVGGIRCYFNVLLPAQLLYEAERPQHDRVLAAHPGVPMSQLYGAPHLLRLFVRIGAMLAYAAFDDKSLALLFSSLHDFLHYLAREPAAFLDEAEYKEAAAGPSQSAA